MECLVVGTSNLRTSSVAAWTDHANLAGMLRIFLIAAGEGPTVLTEILAFAMANALGCVSTSKERDTAAGLSSGSPIPMYTTLFNGGWRGGYEGWEEFRWLVPRREEKDYWGTGVEVFMVPDAIDSWLPGEVVDSGEVVCDSC